MKILVIEDDPTVGEFVRRGLEEQRWQADLVNNGLEGERMAVSQPYDLVILDGFDAESIPVHLRTLEFLEAVKRVLAPGGIAVANVWGRSFNTLYSDMLRTYAAAFEEVYVLDVEGPGTKIFIGCPKTRGVSRAQLVDRAAEVSQRYGFRHALAGALAGFRTAREERVGPGIVLRDP